MNVWLFQESVITVNSFLFRARSPTDLKVNYVRVIESEVGLREKMNRISDEEIRNSDLSIMDVYPTSCVEMSNTEWSHIHGGDKRNRMTIFIKKYQLLKDSCVFLITKRNWSPCLITTNQDYVELECRVGNTKTFLIHTVPISIDVSKFQCHDRSHFVSDNCILQYRVFFFSVLTFQ